MNFASQLFYCRANNTADASKLERVETQMLHLEKAKYAREYYREKQTEAQSGEIQHLSFDYAQQVRFVVTIAFC